MRDVPGERASAILRELRRRRAPVSRSELAARLGVARATLSDALTELDSLGLISGDAVSQSSGGRPPQTFSLNPNAGFVGVLDVGGSRSRVGIADLSGTVLDDSLMVVPVDSGPEAIMEWARSELHRMFSEHLPAKGRRQRPHTTVVAGLPGPVDFTSGTVVSPPIMRTWQGFDVREYLTRSFDAPVIIDNDVNLIALAEQRLSHPDSSVLLVIKLGTGVGGGLVINGTVLRGARGAAGDIGHTQSARAHGSLCRCGHIGCVEAVAGGWALVQELQERGLAVTSVTDVARLVRDGDPIASAHVRAAAKVVGQAVAQAVSLLNPDTVVIAGEMLGAGDQVLSAIRESVYQYSLPLATHELKLVPSTLGSRVGLRGGAQLGIDVLLGQADFPQLHPSSDACVSA